MHVCAVKAYNDVLLLNQMRYQGEIREMPEVGGKDQKISPKEVALAKKLIEQLSEDFDPAAFKDTYVEELQKIIDAKAAGKQIRVATEPKKATATVKDLMSVLKESLNQTKKTA
jgi:DNA end-binding protein Ku